MEENLTNAPESRDPAVFGRNVRAFRILRGWGVRDLAEKCGVSTKTIVKIERGEGCTSRTEQKISLGFAVFLGRLWDAHLLSDERQRVIPHQAGRWFFGDVDDARMFHERHSRGSESVERLRSDPEEIQDDSERHRIGLAGFSKVFVRTQGGGVRSGYFQYNQCEIYGHDVTPGDGFNNTYLVLCERGSIRMGIRGKSYELFEGDSMVYEAGDEYWVEPLDSNLKPGVVRIVCLGILSLDD